MSEQPSVNTLGQLLSAQTDTLLPIDDLLHMTLPLLHEVVRLHGMDRVAQLDCNTLLVDEQGSLHLRNPQGEQPALAQSRVRELQPAQKSALSIVGEVRFTRDSELGATLDNLQIREAIDQPIDKPLFVPGFRSWEQEIGHQDQVTDIFNLGMILACLACGLDFRATEDLQSFAANRRNLFQLNPRLNPVLAGIIVEMTELNRHQRATDLGQIIRRLENWRDQPAGLQVERVLAEARGPASRRTAVLEHLRDRLFDLSRRNRLLYFRPTQANVNLTVASVPLVLNVTSIRPDQLCTWGGSFADQVLSGKTLSLQKWLRFDDQPYLPASFDKLIQETRRDRAEYGFTNLRLVVAFLRWHNLKEAPEERILSPLLWLPVELAKKKGVRDQYTLQCDETQAEFNPVLRHQLRQLYDIQLPESVDLQKISIAEIHADLIRQINQSEPGVELVLQAKPAIKLIHQKAVQRLQQFQRRRGYQRATGITSRPDFSYRSDDYRPLGLALFRQWVKPSLSPLRDAVGVAPAADYSQRYAVANDAVAQSRTYALADDEGHRYAWDIDLTQVTLANFNYKKMSLVRDYTQLIDEPAANEGFDRLFSIEPREVEVESSPAIPLGEQWNVVPADATQNAAVSLARSGRNFIIQGPPGTGKSQTITNLIADYAGRGLRVLFVCEKRAALDVVFHRLQQSGLDDLCCLIHDSQTDKKAFVANLRECYEGWAARPHERDSLMARREAALGHMTEHLRIVERFDHAMGSVPDTLGCSVRQLLDRLIEMPQAKVNLGAGGRERLPTWAAWHNNRELTGRLYGRLKECFGLASFTAHPFSKLSPGVLASDNVYGQLSAFIEEATQLLETLEADMDDPSSLFLADTSINNGQMLAETVRQIVDFNLFSQPDLIDQTSAAKQTLQQQFQALDALAEAHKRASQQTVNWRAPLTAEDAAAALGIETRIGGSLLRFFNPGWWRLRSELHKRYDFSKHAVRPALRTLLEHLTEAQRAEAERLAAENALANQYGVSEAARFKQALEQVTQARADSTLLKQWFGRLVGAHSPEQLARQAASAAQRFAVLEQKLRSNLVADAMTLGELGEYLRDLQEDLEDLPDWIPLLREVHQSDPACVAALREHPLPLQDLETLIAQEALVRVYRNDPSVARFDERALTEAVAQVSMAEREALQLNAKVIAATQHQNFLEQIKRSQLSPSQLDNEGKQFKKNYAKGRRELEHEFGKSMRYRAIRELASGDTGLVIRDLKPIWLMSPLSVSDTLPLDSRQFDVVIFDEASQIPGEEAVPALSRAQQVIVVGDEMQLPPSSFFSTSGDEEEDQVMAMEDGELIAINLDADSLLSQAARSLPATLLAWHYRSRHEALISFSNAAFYDGRLVTIPDRKINQQHGPEAELLESDPDAARHAVERLMATPVSFLKLGDGVYESRINVAEARVIAGTVRELLQQQTGMSIGIVAFSEAQQSEIESALEALAAEDQEFATVLEQEYLREDEGQFNGLFVKNLENVQGDERDIILLSICYAPGPNGKMLMNFGPINQRGGEKRLNVIFSRARLRMGVFTSIHAEAITNTHNDGAAALKAFLQFAAASSRGESERAQSVLCALNPGAQRSFAIDAPHNPFRKALAQALRARGHVVHEHVGSSQFRCDLAIVDETASGYQLGVQLGRRENEANARERYVFQPGVLRSFGWRVIDIPAKQWLSDPSGVIARVEKALVDDPQSTCESIELPVIESTVSPIEEVSQASLATPGMREFRFEQGSSAKFWNISVQGDELTVSFGRMGNKGQTLIKNFDTPEKAEKEANKLIGEKVRKGYVELESNDASDGPGSVQNHEGS